MAEQTDIYLLRGVTRCWLDISEQRSFIKLQSGLRVFLCCAPHLHAYINLSRRELQLFVAIHHY